MKPDSGGFWLGCSTLETAVLRGMLPLTIIPFVTITRNANSEKKRREKAPLSSLFNNMANMNDDYTLPTKSST
jgi:hypothetical protein